MLCLIGQIPILVTKRIRSAYGYINDERITITRPQGLREIFAIKILRDGLESPVSAEDASVFSQSRDGLYMERFLVDIHDMQRSGWQRSRESFRAFKEGLWADNRNAIERILNDIPGVI